MTVLWKTVVWFSLKINIRLRVCPSQSALTRHPAAAQPCLIKIQNRTIQLINTTMYVCRDDMQSINTYGPPSGLTLLVVIWCVVLFLLWKRLYMSLHVWTYSRNCCRGSRLVCGTHRRNVPGMAVQTCWDDKRGKWAMSTAQYIFLHSHHIHICLSGLSVGFSPALLVPIHSSYKVKCITNILIFFTSGQECKTKQNSSLPRSLFTFSLYIYKIQRTTN